ncbi:MAG: class I SAM-dependent methyltransferase [Sphingobacteriales bacterium]|nr:class I SAM-dependent methyltransferase [Sphingobacteriales bacterium]
MNEPFKYQGDELTLFQHATNWKKYFSKKIKPFISGNVLEVGAGMGSTTALLNDGTATHWILSEPDEHLCMQLQTKLGQKKLPANCSILKGTMEDVPGTFDTIIYIDVLEHIEADANELKKAASKLNPGGHIIVLVPAFQHLFSPFDKAIGHYRRYTKKLLRNLTPKEVELIHARYYDSMGYFASFMNKAFLKQSYPTQKQVNYWDKFLVPVSRFTDNLFFHCFGKSIIAVWRK